MANIEEINDSNFDNIINDTDKIVIVDFWAPWCGPCIKMTPVLEQIQNEMQDYVKIVKINADENTKKATEYGVFSLPSLLLFKGGETKEVMVGMMPKSSVISNINKYIM